MRFGVGEGFGGVVLGLVGNWEMGISRARVESTGACSGYRIRKVDNILWWNM